MEDKLFYELEQEYNEKLNKLIDKAHNECKTLKDFIDLGMNAVHYNGHVYYLVPYDNHRSFHYETEADYSVPNEILNKNVKYVSDFESMDGHREILVEDI